MSSSNEHKMTIPTYQLGMGVSAAQEYYRQTAKPVAA
jgi:hypothetical protein